MDLSIRIAHMTGARALRMLFPTVLALSMSSRSHAQLVLGPPTELRRDEFMMSIEYADLDNDGLKDLVALNWDRLIWCKNLGQGNFSSPMIYKDIRNKDAYLYIDVLDADGDGDLDVMSGGTPSLNIWFNDGTGQASSSLQVDSGLTSFEQLNHADVNGDGLVDIVCTAFNSYRWYANLDNGLFGPANIVLQYAYFDHLAIADMDADGDNDLLLAQQDGNGTSWWQNDGAGNFTEIGLVSSSWFVFPHAGDVDSDGDIDLLGMVENQVFVWLERTSPTTFDPVPKEIGGFCAGATSFESVLPFDMDNDGDQDIFTGQCIYKNLGGEVFEPVLPSYEVLPTSRTPFDADGDGDMDVFGGLDTFTTPYDSVSCWVENVGDLSFGDTANVHPITRTYGGSSTFLVEDLNGDGLKDLLCNEFDRHTPIQFMNLGGGQFADGERLLDDRGMANLHLADLDNDDDLDLISLGDPLGISAYSLGIELNDGAGHWGPRTEILTGTYIPDLDVIDFDVDGDVDIVAAMDTYPVLLRNQGNATFLSDTLNAGVGLAEDIQCYHPVGDTVVIVSIKGSLGNVGHALYNTDAELLSGAYLGSNTMISHLNDSNLFFYQFDTALFYSRYVPGDGFDPVFAHLMGIPNFNRGMFSMDIDGDGDNDLMLSSDYDAGGASLHWMERTGPLAFQPPVPIIDQIQWLTASFGQGDMDGIGANDLVYSYGRTLYAQLNELGSTTGTSEITSPSELHAFPVPVSDLLTVTSTEPFRSTDVIELIDTQGRLVHRQPGATASTLSIHCAGLRPGMYLLRVQRERGVALTRVVVD